MAGGLSRAGHRVSVQNSGRRKETRKFTEVQFRGSNLREDVQKNNRASYGTCDAGCVSWPLDSIASVDTYKGISRKKDFQNMAKDQHGSGGAGATHAGTNYQNRVAAWSAVHILAEQGGSAVGPASFSDAGVTAC